jgi:ribosomal protein L40E
MKKFICLHCGANEYSSTDNGKPCQRCMGKMVEVKEEQHE